MNGRRKGRHGLEIFFDSMDADFEVMRMKSQARVDGMGVVSRLFVRRNEANHVELTTVRIGIDFVARPDARRSVLRVVCANQTSHRIQDAVIRIRSGYALQEIAGSLVWNRVGDALMSSIRCAHSGR